MQLGYRPDIDGLRAVAVLAIVLFHIDVSWVPGGFAGVDIFFVISGFLITSNIKTSVASGQFNLADFYVRRVKRLAPALFVMILLTLMAGHFILTPEHLKHLSMSAVASVLSLANFFFAFATDTGYFADDSRTLPLLHLWSLGVEEQFYFLWPLVLAALLARYRHLTVFWMICGGVMLGLLLSEYVVRTDANFAYYMLPSRAFQLLTGALLAFVPSSPGARAKLSGNAAGSVGLALIAASLFFIDESWPFPGISAAPATFGAALVLFAGTRGGHVTQALSLAPLRSIGVISYSLYLWHWPILAFLHYAYVDFTLTVKLAAFGAVLIVAAASYRFVEQPGRHWKVSPRDALQWLFIMPAIVIAILCGGLLATHGYGLYALNSGYRAQAAQLEATTRPSHTFDYICMRSQLNADDAANSNCVINGRREPDILLWGDSNAAHYVGLLAELAKAKNASFRNVAHSACPPVLDRPDRFASKVHAAGCAGSARIVKTLVERYRTVILAASWGTYASFGDAFFDAMQKTISNLIADGRQVIVLGQVVRFSRYDRWCSLKALKIALACATMFSVGHSPGQLSATNERIRKIAIAGGARYADFNALICPDGHCSPYDGDMPLYYDGGHLSVPASWHLGQKAVRSGAYEGIFGAPDQ